MRIAIGHYHLEPGGVSSVARAQALLLAGAGLEVALLSSTPPPSLPGLASFELPGLAYDSRRPRGSPADSLALADEIESALSRAFPGGADLLLFHNPLIAKNGLLLGALRELRRRGLPLLLEVHDFAEDFRPDVYSAREAYPSGCLYGVLGSRDRAALSAAGLGEEGAVLLPNPVPDPGNFEPRGPAEEEIARGRRTVLYPVRAIRRKNLGEALLLSRFLPAGAEMAVTLPPKSAVDLPSYGAWKTFAAAEGYRLRFEAGLSASLDELYASSFAALTVSVKEGFGYAFVEPALRGLPLAGRAIPHLAADFRSAGLGLRGLYESLLIPTSALPGDFFASRIAPRLETLRSAFSPTMEGARLEALLGRLGEPFLGEAVDFGRLDPDSQASYLRRLAASRPEEDRFLSLNPFVPRLFDAHVEEVALESERRAVLSSYSPARCLLALREACEAAVVAGRKGTELSIDKAALLERFLLPEGFFLGAF